MKTAAPLFDDESARIEELKRYKILDTEPEALYTNVTRLAARICETPICAVSFIDKDRLWFKAAEGLILDLKKPEVPRDISFCAHTILQKGLMLVPDATQDERFAQNPFVTGDMHFRFYAGVPLLSSKGYAIGALCVVDNKPRTLTEQQRESLDLLAAQVTLLNEQRVQHEKSRIELFQRNNIISNLATGVMAVNIKGEVMFTNKAFVDLFNLQVAPDTLEGRHYAELVNHFGKTRLPRPQTLIDRLKDMIQNNQPIYGDKIKTREGLIIERDFVPVYFEGEAIGHLWTYRDITGKIKEQKSMEESLKRAEELTVLKSQFLANMSHEIRTPLNGIIGMSGLLLESNLDEQQKDRARNIRDCGDSLLEIVNDILDYSKIEANKLELLNEPFTIQSCIDQALFILDHRASQKGINLNFQVPAGLPEAVVGDAGRLRQILVNLIGNAVKFTHHGQVKVVVRSEPLPDGSVRLHFSVSDTGVGIPKDRMNRLFKSFSQVDSSTSRQYGGTGLGLAISKNLCEMMGGSIHVESEVGVGSTFFFSVKLKQAPGSSVAKKKDTSIMPLGFGLAGSLKILVVDDNGVNQLLALGLLEKMGFKADVANNGIEALELVKRNSYDLILMDVQMPEMSGLEATMHIRRMNLPCQPTIIALTANAMREDEEKCLASGMNDYLSKPIQAKLLVEKIHGVVAKIPKSS